jgi:ABC-type uncharacterized transport system substrate-binding protein
MITHMITTRIAVAALAAGTVGLSQPAQAHPHIWVATETTLLFDKGTVTGVRHRWLFDEYYSTMAIQGLDTNNDGKYDRQELAELAKVNMDGLTEMNYFTSAKLAEQALTFQPPKDYGLEYVEVTEAPGPASLLEDTAPAADEKPGILGRAVKRLTGKAAAPPAPEKSKVLALEFTLPLTTPVLADAVGFTYSIYDPDFMIWFDLAKTNGAKLGPAAPKGCSLVVETPKQSADVQKLSEAMFSQLGGAPGAGMAKSITLKCTKS